MKEYKLPKTVLSSTGYCGGCGHGVIQRLIAEALDETGLADTAVNVVDIACCFWSLDALDFDGIAGPHGRCAAVATGLKKVRPGSTVFIHAGDGASYGIGLAETMYVAMRDIPITMVVVNNGIFGMTGGQLSPATTLLGEKTTSSPSGRRREVNGEPIDFLGVVKEMNVEFAARGALYSPAATEKTKGYIKEGFLRQKELKGFSLIEVLSPCPTNRGVTPVRANEIIKTEIEKQFPLGVYKDRSKEEK